MKIQKAAVIGHPIGHTMSPFIQKRLFSLSGIPMEYQVLDVPDLEAALPELRKLDCFNITIPHKSAIIPFLEDLCESARLCGSVNTVKVEEGKLYGFTTDGAGAAVSLAIHGLDFRRKMLVLGNGGAARAVAFQAAIQQPDFNITIVHREGSYEKAMELAGKLADFARNRGDRNFLVTVKSYQELEEDKSGRYDLLVNTTSVGMYPHPDASPVSGEVVARCGAVFDAVFNPAETKLLQHARNQGIQAIGGMGMLVCQAAYSHKIWYDTEFRNEDLLQLIDDAQTELGRIFGGRP
ncbi:shikimate dehydrogenase family protein [Acutalibacter sp. 1XD8-33]|uniref:shikimate dehydrogenase family protein n=1 Tax=Acutalibacter sp. 1XD8-33 TaxID=2320081 RepID=UPI0013142360|nr:shikimate dehydrogenase [Acutalibacter sp. 1XD8-33]